ncbi:MAG: hypothetical protein V4574_10245 [Pseudomonadota bacterium]
MTDHAGPIRKPARADRAPAPSVGLPVPVLASTRRTLNARPALAAQRRLAGQLSSAAPAQRMMAAFPGLIVHADAHATATWEPPHLRGH